MSEYNSSQGCVILKTSTNFLLTRFKPRFSAGLQIYFCCGGKLRLSCGRSPRRFKLCGSYTSSRYISGFLWLYNTMSGKIASNKMNRFVLNVFGGWRTGALTTHYYNRVEFVSHDFVELANLAD